MQFYVALLFLSTGLALRLIQDSEHPTRENTCTEKGIRHDELIPVDEDVDPLAFGMGDVIANCGVVSNFCVTDGVFSPGGDCVSWATFANGNPGPSFSVQCHNKCVLDVFLGDAQSCLYWFFDLETNTCFTCKNGGEIKICPDGGICGGVMGDVAACGGTNAAAVGDPHVTNLAGEHFDILATGHFTFLQLWKEKQPLYTLEGSIKRIGESCTQTFIDYISLSGSAVREKTKHDIVEVKPSSNGLLVALHGKWQEHNVLPHSPFIYALQKSVHFRIELAQLKVSVDEHWGWKYLNLNFHSLQLLVKARPDLHFGGLLAFDDHAEASKPSNGCANFRKEEQGDTLLSSIAM